MLEGLEEIVDEFLVESNEGLDQLDADLLALEQNPDDAEVIGSIFRTIHTIKGTSGFLGLTKLESVAHTGESLLSLLRDGSLAVDQEIVSALLALTDAVRTILDCIATRQDDGDDDYAELIALLTRLRDGERDSDPTPQGAADGIGSGDEENAPPSAVRDPLGQVLVESGLIEPADLDRALALQAEGDDRKIGEILAGLGVLDPAHLVETQRPPSGGSSTPASPASVPPAASPPEPASGETKKSTNLETTVRVDVGLLDSIVDLVGELVLARNQIVQSQSNTQDRAAIAQTQHLSYITSEMQEQVMRTRMQPIDRVWQKIPRVVRDLAVACGKQVRVEMVGQDTELDRTLVEALKDPLTHLVRNAVDHGIEMPDVRVANGKPAEAVLTMRAFHDGGQVIIEISDDGAGIDLERVKAKALEQNLATEEQLGRMHEHDVVNLIFLPGFSTAAQVTNVSGRGVGMDVVKTNIEKIRGSLEVHTTAGAGTTLRMAIPLTLAIVPALIVNAAGQRYAIPQVNVRELVRLKDGDNDRAIERVHGAPVLRLRDKLLPLADLASVLEVDDGSPRATATIVVLRNGERSFGLLVDNVASAEEIVVKPLGKLLEQVSGFAGATIMGDGRVALILDIPGIAERSRVGSEGRAETTGASDGDRFDDSDTMTFLTCRIEGRRVAVPFEHVLRLEQFEWGVIERTGGQDVVQYDGGLLPLIGLEQLRGDDQPPTHVSAVVCEDAGSQFGLVVQQVLDIVQEAVEIQHGRRGERAFESAVIQQQVTDLLDPQEIIRNSGAAVFVHQDAGT